MNHSPITTIISGGQTGADRGGLDAAMQEGITTTGFVSKGRLAEDGKVPSKYPLEEMSAKTYPPRTRANAKLADFTVIFTTGELTGGSLLTQNICIKLGKPCLHIDLDGLTNARKRRTSLRKLDQQTRQTNATTLNVAGSRESQSPGLQEKVCGFMLEFFNTELS
jgi:predicted Rossmann fold nucleotide-binding protein DprA/Smf involved in DNA uptake